MPATFPEIQDGQPTPKKAQADSASGEMVDMGTIKPLGLSPALMAASLALDAKIRAAGVLPGNDPDADCWPHSTAMNSTEILLFTARLHRFTGKGLTRADGEALDDMLVTRDRDADDRQFCLECKYLSSHGDTSWRCGNWQAAGIAIRPRDTLLPADLVFQLQRCDGFANAMSNAKTSAIANLIVKTSF